MTEKILVSMTDVPLLVQDMLRQTIASERDIQLVDWKVDVAPARVATAPHALIVGEPWTHRKNAVAEIVLRWPHTRILMVTTTGDRAALYELRPHKRELGELSPAELVNAIRSSVRRWRTAIRRI